MEIIIRAKLVVTGHFIAIKFRSLVAMRQVCLFEILVELNIDGDFLQVVLVIFEITYVLKHSFQLVFNVDPLFAFLSYCNGVS